MWLADCMFLLYIMMAFALAEDKLISQSTEIKPSNFENGQGTRDDDSKRTVHSILNNLEKGKKMVTLASNRNIVLVLGNTGAGKSTLVQLIAGNNSNLISTSTSVDGLPTGEFTIKDMGNKIGINSLLSHTQFPELVFDNETKTAIYDCPGFSDTRNAVYDISGSYYIKYLLDHAEAIKFVFVVNYNSVKKGHDKSDFLLLATHATNMIKNITKFKDGIAIVATKITEDIPNDFIINNIVVFLKDFRSGLSEIGNERMDGSQKQNIYRFVDGLLTKNDTNGTRFPRIGFFKSVKEEGPLSNITAMQDNKKLLNLLLHKNIKYIKSHKEDFGYTISDKSQNYIIQLVDEVNDNILSSVRNIAKIVKEYYYDLVKNMVQKINSFVNSPTHVDSDSSEAQSFLTKLNTGYKNISTWTIEIEDVKTPEELSNKIKIILTDLDFNITQDSISNIMTQGGYLEFLQMVGKNKETSLLSTAWVSEWQNCSLHLRQLKDDIQENVNAALQQIIVKIKQNITESGNQIKTFFSNREEKNNDIAKLNDEINSAYFILLNTSNIANHEISTEKCIQKIKDDINRLNITDTVNSPAKLLSSTMANGIYVDFLQILQSVINKEPFKCADELNNVIEYLESSKKWYWFLTILIDHLSEYKIQRNTAECKELSNNLIKDGGLKPFLNKCYPKSQFSDIENIPNDTTKFLALKKVLNTTLKSDIISICKNESLNNDPYNKLVIKGQYVKLKDIDEYKYDCKNPKIIEIFALKKVFIDVDLDKTGEEIELFIIAPIWVFHGNRKIVLNGKSGEAHSINKAKDGEHSSRNGEDGDPGKPGGPGGNFTGIGKHFINVSGDFTQLTIHTSGGNGGNGQNGGNGVNGTADPDFKLNDIGTLDDLKISVYRDIEKGGPCWNEYEDEKIIIIPFPSLIIRLPNVSYTCSHGLLFHNFPYTYRKDLIFLNVVFNVFLLSSENGKNCIGGNGGHGGIGGEYGYPGTVTIISLLDKISPKIVNNEGIHGLNGTFGKFGEGGDCSKELVVGWENPLIFGEGKSWEYHTKPRCQCPNGIIGKNEKKFKYREWGSSFLQASHTINDYKIYLRENLISDIEKSKLEEFLGLIENSNDVNNTIKHI